jgi:hypothetical protein
MAISKLCASHHPSALVLSDGDDKAIDLLKLNLANPVNQIDASSVGASLLNWGVNGDGAFVDSKFFEWCRANFTVWSSETTVVFDCIVAGDVLYKAELPEIFFRTAYALLSKKFGSSLWLCHVPRHGVTQECVVEAAHAVGFVVHTVEMPLLDNIRSCPLEDVQRAVIYRMCVAS